MERQTRATEPTSRLIRLPHRRTLAGPTDRLHLRQVRGRARPDHRDPATADRRHRRPEHPCRLPQVDHQLPYTFAWNVLSWPSISIPAGFTAEGLPVGAQLMGGPDCEPLLISLAAQLESELRWHHHTPALITTVPS
ncbi:amidase family protein [Nocardia sp. NPDC059091]|uniref:amidase family protein n=1 Tax=unclassified Nocardia TaxID=2637762 RepID=UPI0036ABA89B